MCTTFVKNKETSGTGRIIFFKNYVVQTSVASTESGDHGDELPGLADGHLGGLRHPPLVGAGRLVLETRHHLDTIMIIMIMMIMIIIKQCE